ncbi:MAG TPA: peptidoglycan-associated lipoprotein Pal [Gemmatimonadaceae bacterium]|nr:peptidoglycan-associated lipoprotein Pal [Gemmatimonadaceae bacterium]
MTRAPRAVPLLAIALALTAAACHKQQLQPATPQPADLPPTTSMVDSAAIRDSLDRARAAEEEAARRRADSLAMADRERELAEARAALLAPVYFEFDQAELAEDARMTLDAKVPVLVANPGLRLRIAGHTDSRGSDEYNVALGQRRAVMVREYLVQHGVDASRLDVVSYGEERPAVEGENEGAWAQNRRAEFQIVGGELSNMGDD